MRKLFLLDNQLFSRMCHHSSTSMSPSTLSYNMMTCGSKRRRPNYRRWYLDMSDVVLLVSIFKVCIPQNHIVFLSPKTPIHTKHSVTKRKRGAERKHVPVIWGAPDVELKQNEEDCPRCMCCWCWGQNLSRLKTDYLRHVTFYLQKNKTTERMIALESKWLSDRVVEWGSKWLSGWLSWWLSQRASDWESEWLSKWANDWESEWLSKTASDWPSDWERKQVIEQVGEWWSERARDWKWLREHMIEWLSEKASDALCMFL